ncbi:C2 domain-containing protein 3 [Oopsacas minuta]|uniref:C2 domain-containing protein 3 n=1 Tax=Oopsacas minuta TaxID=111878 RepID=A0AAV7JTX8_9METZ|nr:C2 domain-containing protein 3 [Oopsacas minuta]
MFILLFTGTGNGEFGRDEILESPFEPKDKLKQYDRASNTAPIIDPIIGLLLSQDPLHTDGFVPGEYNQFLEESLVKDSSLIEDILYLNGSTAARNDRILNELEMEFGGDIDFTGQNLQNYTTQEEIPIQDKGNIRKETPIITDHLGLNPDESDLSYASIRDRLGSERIAELERVYAVKIYIEKLIFNSQQLDLIIKQTSPSQLSRIYRSTYIVEYQLDTTGGEKRSRRPEESTRVITRKMDGDGNIIFNHRTVMPICLTGGVIKKWWSNILEFKIYKKNLGQKKAINLGVSVINLKSVLESQNLNMTSSLDVQIPTHLQREQYPSHLDVIIELASEPLRAHRKPKQIDNTDGIIFSETKEKHVTFACSPSHTEEPYNSSDQQESSQSDNDIPITSGSDPLRLNLLLLVTDGSEISVSSKQCPWRGVNPYLVAKLFCADPAPQSSVHWENGAPKFAFRQLFPIQLTHNILTTRLCNKVVVIEVWHKETNRNKPSDELIGLVQLSLHQFYINFTHPENVAQSLQGQYPVL